MANKKATVVRKTRAEKPVVDVAAAKRSEAARKAAITRKVNADRRAAEAKKAKEAAEADKARKAEEARRIAAAKAEADRKAAAAKAKAEAKPVPMWLLLIMGLLALGLLVAIFWPRGNTPVAPPAPVVVLVQPPAPAVVQSTAQTAGNSGSIQTYDYVPGGEGFGKWATDVTHPSGYVQGTCGRVWQATNLENLAWVTMFCNWQTSDPAPRLQWTHPTELTITDTGTVKFELWRDHGADNASSPSPYDVANQKQSPLGLGWFAQGFNAEICVNGKCQPLNGRGVFQIGFPKDLQGHYDISITVNSGQAHFWQGEKVTSTDNWPLP